MNALLRAAHDKLEQAVAAIVSGDEWQRMLEVASRFHRYSFNNQLLIYLQCPDATLVAGYRRWRDLGRQVRKGEKGIAILGPCRYRRKVEAEDGEDQPVESVRGFRVVYVFDISQTEGEEIIDLGSVRPSLLSGDAPEGLWDALVAQARTAGFEVVRTRRGSENGYCDFAGRQIAVRRDVEPLQAVKTLVHELAHALLRGDGVVRNREIEEVEVESIAFVVLDALGLDTGDYSFPYVARWCDGDLEMLRDTAERVVTCASRILRDLVVGELEPALE